ncbi:hypothetical protein HUN43_00054 [Streptomyces phage Endor1]|uniref:Uncharacterized protein n=1 Tax=Streptomyces phage Endor1 TaxID=2740181 RepID=A0A7G4AWX8_9CAUD|nr:hypothetical protein KGG92_gp54 [Streptomyces phage Endor1]QMP84518.1 hypothetical protein HUN43_00054 [Streptomyces phage Endor1]
MAIEFWRVRWTDLEGNRRESVVSYDRTTRDERLAELASQGMTDVEPFLYDPFTGKEITQ